MGAAVQPARCSRATSTGICSAASCSDATSGAHAICCRSVRACSDSRLSTSRGSSAVVSNSSAIVRRSLSGSRDEEYSGCRPGAIEENNMADPVVAKIQANPMYLELRKKRNRIGWFLATLMMVVYYGYIALIAFDKEFLAPPIGNGVTTLGTP